MTAPAMDRKCGECAWWERQETALWGRCAPSRHNTPGVTIGEGRPACPAFQSRDSAEKQSRLIEAVKGLIDESMEILGVESYIDLNLLRLRIAAVEAAMKEVEP